MAHCLVNKETLRETGNKVLVTAQNLISLGNSTVIYRQPLGLEKNIYFHFNSRGRFIIARMWGMEKAPT